MELARVEDLPGWARELIERSPVARLGLLDDDARPRVLPVTFAVAAGGLVSAVDEHKAKRVAGRELARVRWLRERPQAALTVDRYDDDWSRLAWVQALGRADVVDAAPAGALDALRAKYAPYRERDPGGPFVLVRPERFVCWRADG